MHPSYFFEKEKVKKNFDIQKEIFENIMEELNL